MSRTEICLKYLPTEKVELSGYKINITNHHVDDELSLPTFDLF